jgi:hypothetical protein
MRLLEIVASVVSSIMYVHFAAFRYDVDQSQRDNQKGLQELSQQNYANPEII